MTTRGSDYGLAYKALDLHVHTPASRSCYQDKGASATDIVQAAIEAGLDGICITDHNTAEWIDAVTEAAKGKPITIFPGVEISVTGGKEGPIHIVGIFEPGHTSEEIHDILATLGLTKAKRGKTEELATGDPNSVVDCLARHGGIPILAHADSSHGVLHDMKGKPRTQVVQNPRLLAAEVSSEKTRKLLDGTDSEYQRFLTTYEVSDAHSLSEIGTKRTYFRVGSLSLEGLLQCLYDPRVRILRQDEYDKCKDLRFPRIVGVRIDQGFFSGEQVVFHPCQNTVIGGQGVGKSLLVEFIRFALDQPSSIREIAADTEGKLEERLGTGGQVSVEVELANGTRYEIRRTYDGARNPMEAVNAETGELYRGEIARLFPVMAYSQTEAVHIAWNPHAQLELIDRFIDALRFRHRMEEIQAELRNNDQEFTGIIDARERLASIKKDLHTVNEDIANVEKSLKSSAFGDMKSADEQRDAFEAEREYHDTLVSPLEELLQELASDYQAAVLPKKLARNERLNECNQLSRSALRKVLAAVRAVIKAVRASKTDVEKLYRAWLPEYEEIEARHKAFIGEAGGDQKSLESRRKSLEEKKKRLQKDIRALEAKVRRLEGMLKSRKTLLNELDAVMLEFYQARKQKYDELTEMSEGRIHLSISQAADYEAFASALKEIATGTRIRKVDLAAVAEKVSPREFIDLVLADDRESLAAKIGADPDTIDKLVGWLMALEAREAVLALQHQYPLQDVPSIRFRKEDGGYHEISTISIGQRCTALLIIALSAGDYPVIIDQPEESIDIASVFDDIVSKLRSGKDKRQYILTTHNPNIAVTADSDLIQVLRSSATEGHIVNRGAIEDYEVRREVIQHLEGGKEPYLLRGTKYGLLKPESREAVT